ncbi:unnamed protein product [Cladocopium goreaui]|uniref:Kinase D-interacting substrate of 220 kDa n=1 Tax=Cladocopium goreaui TaxID=2562237 RepID=A0A9P1GN96_9DINO|nr:unnamed protein product [Cladocopium goreaui]
MASNVCPALRNAPKKDEKKYVENHLAACHCNDAPCQQRDNTMQLPRKRLKLKIAFSGSSSTASAMCLFKPETNQTTETISSSPSSQTESGGSKAEARRRNVQEKKLKLEEMLQTAAAASKAASTTTLKRRIRQRLHKKLGSVFSKKDFALAMERFKLLEAEDEDREPMPFEPEALLSGNLPVRFTFIHFSTPARRKRSHSV